MDYTQISYRMAYLLFSYLAEKHCRLISLIDSSLGDGGTDAFDLATVCKNLFIVQIYIYICTRFITDISYNYKYKEDMITLSALHRTNKFRLLEG